MSRPKDRKTAQNLLPRMESRPWRDGKTITYRFHPIGSKSPINLGTDRSIAIQKVLDLNFSNPDKNTVNEIWRLYIQSSNFQKLAPSTQKSYQELSKPVLKVFGEANPKLVRPTDINKYLRVERSAAPVTANREVALLSNLFNLSVELGQIDSNPCKQVRRNSESPRTKSPKIDDLENLVLWLKKEGGQRVIFAQMAQFAAFSGNRRGEFLRLTWSQIDLSSGQIRLKRIKQRNAEIWENISIGENMAELLNAMTQTKNGREYVFCNRSGSAYTESGFKSMWSKLMAEALKTGVVKQRFTFHDLRAFYTTEHKKEFGNLPDLHKNPATTARIYDRSTEVKRKAS